MIFFKKLSNFALILAFLATSSCGLYKKVDQREMPDGASAKARKNIEEGRGAGLGDLLGRSRNTNYEFSTSNPLWRASLETIDFIPLATVDYSGGIIITDWYSDDGNPNEALKITLRFMSNEIQSNSIKVIIHNKNCSAAENCTIKEIESNLKFEIQKSILSKAAILEKESKKSKK